MFSSRETSAFLELLRAGLWQRAPQDMGHFPLSGREWEEVFRLARRQTVGGLVYQGLAVLPDELLPPPALLVRWVAEVDAIERSNRRMNRVLADCYGTYVRHGLHPVLQKGQGVARFYDEPLQRVCGDIDLYFPDSAEAREAVRLAGRPGRRARGMADGGVCCVWDGVEVEIHERLIDVYTPFARRRLAALEAAEGWQSFRLPGAPGLEVQAPAPLLNVLLLNTHILKHALGWGIGLRQFCDLARACHSLRGQLDADLLRHTLRRLGLGRWTRLLHAFLVEYVGLSPDSLPCDELGHTARPLLDIVLRGGNFGLYAAGRAGLRTVWARKLRTSRSYVRNVGFAARYAPQEAFWTFVRLSKGQFQRK